MTAPVPTDIQPPPTNLPVTDKEGRMPLAWRNFFQALVAAPAAVIPLTVGASPFMYQASVRGHVLVRGGTVSALQLVRARVTITPLGFTAGFVPLSRGDQLTVTYTVLPTMWFIPW